MTTHIITEHFNSPAWVPLQARQFERHVRGEYRTYTCLEGIEDRSYGRYFTRVVEGRGGHAGKMNYLARVALEDASDDDLIMFIDGDAFPVTNLSDKVDGWLSEAPLAAIRRDENLGDPQPHPCFCVTTARFWKSLRGEWSGGYAWQARDGTLRTDVGANLLYGLKAAEVSWKPLLRTNQHDLHPVFFGVYAHTVYHHGRGFRRGLSRQDSVRAPRKGGLRYRLWRRRRAAELDDVSEQVFDRLSRDCDSLQWLGEPGPAR
jgi:hypothetical protein